jgi:hypothetical protein
MRLTIFVIVVMVMVIVMVKQVGTKDQEAILWWESEI